MYDYVICDYPLPGSPPAWAAVFQTKSFGEELETYRITSDGKLDGLPEFTGSVEFYTNNIVASGPGIYTKDGEDAEYVEFRALFIKGSLISIEMTEHTKEPAAKRKPWSYAASPSKDEIDARKAREGEALTGKTIYVWWGGAESGYEATVVAENARQIVVESPRGEFENLSRSDRDRIFFDSMDDGQKDKDSRAAEWGRKKTEYDSEIAAKKAAIAASEAH